MNERPPETDVSRLTWLLPPDTVLPLGLIGDPNSPPSPRIVRLVLDVAARLTGSIWFYYVDEHGKRRLFMGRP